VARTPLDASRPARAAGESLGARPKAGSRAAGDNNDPATTGKFKILATGERLAHKPEHLTQLVDDESLIDKSHPRLPLRGKLDTLQGLLLEAQVTADADGARGLVGELGEALELTRAIVGAEVTGRALPAWRLAGLSPAELRHHSHHTHELYGVPFMFPSVRQGPVVARLYTARAYAREAELALYLAFPHEEERTDLKLALNRLSSALYLMTIKYVANRYAGEQRRPGPVKGWKPPKK
jgi:ethanolamine utilization cobalamin adenosyltransferase